MRFDDLEGIIGDADSRMSDEKTFLSEVTRGSNYRPSDIVGIGFAETSGGDEEVFSDVFFTSRGETEYYHWDDAPMDVVYDNLSAMIEDSDVCYDDAKFIRQRIDELGNPSPRFINMGSKKNPYVLVLYVRASEGKIQFRQWL